MAFVQQDDVYVIDSESVLKIETDVKTYCENVNEFIGEDAHRQRVYPYAVESADHLLTAYSQFKDSLSQLRLPLDEVRLYQRKHIKGEYIKQYEQIKTRLKYAMIPMLHQQRSSDVKYPALDTQGRRFDTNQKTILNHNNPFADITIENQAFIYPGDDGSYQTLQFHTGYTMSKVEDETSCAVVLQPDFKISKTDDRDIVRNTITMDNSISTKLPDKQGGQELIYI